jgi:hypothetical protein
MAHKKPLIDIEDKAPDVRIPINFRPEDAEDLKIYSEYAHGSSVHHIVKACVRRTLQADKGFQEFKANRAGVSTLPAVETKAKRSQKGAGPEAVPEQAQVA